MVPSGNCLDYKETDDQDCMPGCGLVLGALFIVVFGLSYISNVSEKQSVKMPPIKEFHSKMDTNSRIIDTICDYKAR